MEEITSKDSPRTSIEKRPGSLYVLWFHVLLKQLLDDPGSADVVSWLDDSTDSDCIIVHDGQRLLEAVQSLNPRTQAHSGMRARLRAGGWRVANRHAKHTRSQPVWRHGSLTKNSTLREWMEVLDVKETTCLAWGWCCPSQDTDLIGLLQNGSKEADAVEGLLSLEDVAMAGAVESLPLNLACPGYLDAGGDLYVWPGVEGAGTKASPDGEARGPRRLAWTTMDTEETAYWAEAAGIATCQLDLSDLLLLEDLHVATGSYILACEKAECARCYQMMEGWL